MVNSIAIAFGMSTTQCWTCGTQLESDAIEDNWHYKGNPQLFCSEECSRSFPLEDEKDPGGAIHWAIAPVLKVWGLPDSEKFRSPDGLVVVALLCNAAAKFIDECFYDYKPALVEAAALVHNFVWYDDGIVYFETCVGQLSFHVFDESPIFDLLPSANGRQWRGGWMQDEALSIARAFLGSGDDELEFSLRRFLTIAQEF